MDMRALFAKVYKNCRDHYISLRMFLMSSVVRLMSTAVFFPPFFFPDMRALFVNR